jgi:hypothetical protein
MGGTAFIPGVGWILGAVYFIADPIVKHYTGKSIGENVGEAINKAASTFTSMWSTFTSGLLNLEYALSKGLLSR